jgi:DNA invertase Pin-like site-specific DNA recombinase
MSRQPLCIREQKAPPFHNNSQKEISSKYARENGFKNIQYIIDDGYSGTNFNRPGWNEL